jgi:histidine phosphotransferase ChpT
LVDLKLAALMCSKLCHDVIGPIGAVNNGIELLQDDDSADMREQATELVAQSASEAAARLQFYRLAFGLAGGMGTEISLRDARNLCREFLSFGKVNFNWPDDHGGVELLQKEAIKIICNSIALAAGGLPRGGALMVTGQVSPENWSFTLTATGARAGLKEETLLALTEGYDEDKVTAQNIQAYFLMALIENTGASINVSVADEGSLTINIHS